MRLVVWQAQLGSRKVLTSNAEQMMYRHDAILIGETPLLVVLPESSADVVTTVRWTNQHGLAIFRRGQRFVGRRCTDQ